MKEEKDVKKVKRKKLTKKLKISDIKHGEGAHVGHLLARMKAREVELTVCCVVVSLAIVIVSLYFVFSAVRDPKKYNTTTVGNFSVSFNQIGESLGNIVNLTPLTPMSDADGLNTIFYGVHIENTSDKRENFQIVLQEDYARVQEDQCDEWQLPYQYLHYQIEDSNVLTFTDTSLVSPVLLSSYLEPYEKRTYQIKVWVSDSTPLEYLNYHYHGKLVVIDEDNMQ